MKKKTIDKVWDVVVEIALIFAIVYISLFLQQS